LSNKTISKRYAQALLEIAQEENKISEFSKQLEIIKDNLVQIPILQYAWYENKLTKEDKKRVIEAYFTEKTYATLLSFLYILIDKKREIYFEKIVLEFKDLADFEKEFLEVNVGTAVKLSDSEVQKLTNRISDITGKKVRLKTEVIPDIIGGIILKIDDKIIDSSVVKRLAMIGKELEGKISYEDDYLKKFLFSPKEIIQKQTLEAVAEVFSSIKLSDNKIKNLEDKLSEKMGRKVTVHNQVDSSLLGGITVKIGDKVIDGSVRKRLVLLEKEIGKAIESWGEQ
jgi:F-type H+-transporting ATPase subunit delta